MDEPQKNDLSAPSQFGDYRPPVPLQAEVRELPYHRLAFSDAKHRWWKPLAEGGAGVLLYFVLSIGFGLTTMILLRLYYPEVTLQVSSARSTEESLISHAMSNPFVFLMLFGSVALMFPVLWFMRFIFGPRPWGLVHSVVGRMRWGWLLTCAGVALIIYVLLPAVFDLAVGNSFTPAPQAQETDLIWMLLLLLLVVPLQSYAEELVFRGYLMQTIGRWLKNPLWAILIPSLIFMFGHTQYDLWGLLSVLTMGLAAGFLAWRTGGLEAGIGLHAINNLTSMGFGIFGLADPFLQEGATFAAFASSLIIQLLFVGAVIWLARRQKIQRVPPVIFRSAAPVSVAPQNIAQ